MDEYIKREALLKLLCGDKCGCYAEDCGMEERCYTGKIIEAIPAADVAPVVNGKWIEDRIIEYNDAATGEYADTIIVSHCSNCNMYHDRYLTKTEWNYCPNCGARMDLEVNDAEIH